MNVGCGWWWGNNANDCVLHYTGIIKGDGTEIEFGV